MATATTEREEIELGAPADVRLRMPAGVRMVVSPEGFDAICAANRDLRLERTGRGELIVMTPASYDSGSANSELTFQLALWNRATKPGRTFDSSTGFTFPDESVLAPDAAWIARERDAAVPAAERRRFARIVPDFVAELRSPTDRLPALQEKMRQYVAHGVRLAWLIDPIAATVEVHRPGRDVETLAKPATLPGEDVLPGFTLDLEGILFD